MEESTGPNRPPEVAAVGSGPAHSPSSAGPCYSRTVHPATMAGFLDELEKISAAQGRAEVSKTRTGRRPISAETLVEKHNEGTWLKKHADSAGNPQDVRGDSVDDPGAAQPPKRQGEVPSKERGNVPEGQKTGMVPGANQQTQPFTSGEETLVSPETRKPRQPGDVPTQGPAQAMIAPPGSGVVPGSTRGEAVHPRKKGDVPTRDRDLNIVDRNDLRESTTTVTGLGQHSTNIGASNNPAEHT